MAFNHIVYLTLLGISQGLGDVAPTCDITETGSKYAGVSWVLGTLSYIPEIGPLFGVANQIVSIYSSPEDFSGEWEECIHAWIKMSIDETNLRQVEDSLKTMAAKVESLR